MNEFIRDQNIGNFIDRLHREGDGETRRTLQQLLIAEEDNFGRISERIDSLTRWIEDGEKRITKLKVLLSAQETVTGSMLLKRSDDLLSLLRTLRAEAEKRLDKNALT